MTFLTWNLAMLQRSAQAPHAWGIEHTEARFREFVLALGPDLVLLQELPNLVPFVETHGMVKANPRSHHGNLATLVRADLLASHPPELNVIEGCAILTTFGDLTIANVHLAPGSGAVPQRLEQLAEIVEASPTARILIAGDTNTRLTEEDPLAAAELRGERPPRPTWDSKRNRFNSGLGARDFTAYFTRWFASPGVAVSDVVVHDDPVEFEGHRFHLSDHFPLAGRVEVVGS